MPKPNKTDLPADNYLDDDRVWPVTLRLRRRHWHLTEDIADLARRAGCRYRLGPSEIIRGVLDATLPAVLKANFKPLAEETAGQDQVTSRVTVARFIKDVLSRRLRRR